MTLSTIREKTYEFARILRILGNAETTLVVSRGCRGAKELKSGGCRLTLTENKSILGISQQKNLHTNPISKPAKNIIKSLQIISNNIKDMYYCNKCGQYHMNGQVCNFNNGSGTFTPNYTQYLPTPVTYQYAQDLCGGHCWCLKLKVKGVAHEKCCNCGLKRKV